MQHPDCALSAQRHAGVPADAGPVGLYRTPTFPSRRSIASMDAADVELGMLSAWRGPNGQDLISNDEVAQWIGLHPNRFAGLATVDLDRPMEAVRELRRRVADRGFVGLRSAIRRRSSRTASIGRSRSTVGQAGEPVRVQRQSIARPRHWRPGPGHPGPRQALSTPNSTPAASIDARVVSIGSVGVGDRPTRPPPQGCQHVAAQKPRSRMLHPDIDRHCDCDSRPTPRGAAEDQQWFSAARAQACVRAARSRRRTARRAPAAGRAGAGRCGCASRSQRPHPLVAVEDGVVVRAAEQREHRQVGLAVAAVRGRVDQHHRRRASTSRCRSTGRRAAGPAGRRRRNRPHGNVPRRSQRRRGSTHSSRGAASSAIGPSRSSA